MISLTYTMRTVEPLSGESLDGLRLYSDTEWQYTACEP